MPRKAANYQNGIQYKIVCKDPAITDCYNGSCISFKDRKRNHKSMSCNPNCKAYNFKVYRFIRENGGWDNWTFIQLEIFPCNSKQELVAREREIFDVLKPTLNTNSPTRNVQKKKQTMAKYYDDNKDEKKIYQKQYNEDHKVVIAAKHKEKVNCVCGCEIKKYDLKIHQKSKKHLNLVDQLK